MFLNCGTQSWTQFSRCGLIKAQWSSTITFQIHFIRSPATDVGIECNISNVIRSCIFMNILNLEPVYR